MKKNNQILTLFLLIVPVFIVSLYLAIFKAPDLLTNYYIHYGKFYGYDFQTWQGYASPIATIITPFIAVIASVLTFLAFWVQYKANIQQQEDLKRERFENKLYKMIDIHIKNVEGLYIDKNISGRKSFDYFFNQLNSIHKSIRIINNQENNTKNKIWLSSKYNNEDELVRLSYSIFYFGINDHTKENYYNELSDIGKSTFHHYRDQIKAENQTSDGHSNQLSQYYRHLYQTVKFVLDQNEEFIDYNQKLEYIKTIRAQLSDHEQLILYINIVVWFKNNWTEAICKYFILKNVPFSLLQFCKNPFLEYKNELRIAKELYKKEFPERKWQPFNLSNDIK